MSQSFKIKFEFASRDTMLQTNRPLTYEGTLLGCFHTWQYELNDVTPLQMTNTPFLLLENLFAYTLRTTPTIVTLPM